MIRTYKITSIAAIGVMGGVVDNIADRLIQRHRSASICMYGGSAVCLCC
jgi:hypothetical protein